MELEEKEKELKKKIKRRKRLKKTGKLFSKNLKITGFYSRFKSTQIIGQKKTFL